MTRCACLLTLLLLIPLDSLAFRCGTKLVAEGDYFGEVLDKCGEPTHREKWVENRIYHYRPHPLLDLQETVGGVVIQLWTYNRGSTRFMRQLRFENGVLKKIESLGYGY